MIGTDPATVRAIGTDVSCCLLARRARAIPRASNLICDVLNPRDEVLNLIRAVRDFGGEVFYLVCVVRDLGDRLFYLGGKVLYLGGEAFYLVCAVRDFGDLLSNPSGEAFYPVCAVRDLGDRLSDPGGEVFYPIHTVCNPGSGLAARSADLAGKVRRLVRSPNGDSPRPYIRPTGRTDRAEKADSDRPRSQATGQCNRLFAAGLKSRSRPAYGFAEAFFKLDCSLISVNLPFLQQQPATIWGLMAPLAYHTCTRLACL